MPILWDRSTWAAVPFRTFLARADEAQDFMADGSDPAVRRDFLRVRDEFDQRPFVVRCSQNRCSKLAQRMSIQFDTGTFSFWCAKHEHAETANRVTTVTTFDETMSAIDERKKRGRQVKRMAIREMAIAKGVHPKITEVAARQFFAGKVYDPRARRPPSQGKWKSPRTPEG
jgi:hypothetical protein